LVDTVASDQTRESINEFLTSIKWHILAKVEVPNILNTRPIINNNSIVFIVHLEH